MYTKAEPVIENEKMIVVPPLPLGAVLHLPKFVKPNKNNLATQYYFWNRELMKEIWKLKDKKSDLEQELARANEKISELETQNENLQSQKNRFLDMLFKKRKPNLIKEEKYEPILRTKESYVRATPQTIDEHRECKLQQCPFCNNELLKQIDSYQRIVEDIPDYEQQKAKSIQYTIHRYYCKHCKKIITAKPKDVLPKNRLGINTLLYVLHSKYRLRLSHDLIRENINTQFSLAVSDGQITDLLEKGCLAFQNKWQEIIETIKHSKTANSDETSWHICFFQAEDGIRDWSVTGVQTCALPISCKFFPGTIIEVLPRLLAIFKAIP